MATLEQLESAFIKADAAGNIDDAKVFAAEIRRMRTEPPATERQPAAAPTGGFGRQLGLTGRAAVTGLTAIPGMLADVPFRLANLGKSIYDASADAQTSRLPLPSEQQQRLLTRLGLPEPETGAERFGQAIASGMAGGVAGPGNALLNVMSGAGAGAGGQGIAELGGGPLAQLVGSIAGGVAGGRMAPGAPSVSAPFVPRDPNALRAVQFAEQQNIPLTAGQLRAQPTAPTPSFLQNVERMAAVLPGSRGYYTRTGEAQQQGVNRTINELIGGDPRAMYQALQGRNLTIDPRFIAEQQAIPARFSGLAPGLAPTEGLRIAGEYGGSPMIPNPALARLGPQAQRRAIAQGVPATVPSAASPRFPIGTQLPTISPQGDFNSYQAIRSELGGAARNALSNADEQALLSVQRAFDDLAQRQIPQANLPAIRGSYQIERLLAPALDTATGNYSVQRVRQIINQVQQKEPGRLERIEGRRGETLQELQNLAPQLRFAPSSQTAENQLARWLLTGGMVGGGGLGLAGGDIGNALSSAAIGGAGVLAAPWATNALIQAMARRSAAINPAAGQYLPSAVAAAAAQQQANR